MTRNRLVSLPLKQMINWGLLALSWTLLLWLNFAITPNAFAHFVAIPSLFIASGLSALLCTRAHSPV